MLDALFARFHEQLASHGYVARSGQMVDATFVEVPRQRNKREENALIKEDAVPIDWGNNPHKLAQKDVEARDMRTYQGATICHIFNCICNHCCSVKQDGESLKAMNDTGFKATC